MTQCLRTLGRITTATALAFTLAAPDAQGAYGAQPSGNRPFLEPLSAALASGRVGLDDVRGREVYAFDETRIGTLAGSAATALVVLDPGLGFSRRCLAMPPQRLRLDAEHRLLLDMTPQEFRAAVASREGCGA